MTVKRKPSMPACFLSHFLFIQVELIISKTWFHMIYTNLKIAFFVVFFYYAIHDVADIPYNQPTLFQLLPCDAFFGTISEKHFMKGVVFYQGTIKPKVCGSGRNRKQSQGKKYSSRGRSAKCIRHCSSSYHTSASNASSSGSGSNGDDEEDDWKKRKRPPRSAPPFLDRDVPPKNATKSGKTSKSKRIKIREKCRHCKNLKNLYVHFEVELEIPFLGKNITHTYLCTRRETVDKPHQKKAIPKRRRMNWPLEGIAPSRDSAEGLIHKDQSIMTTPPFVQTKIVRKIQQSEVLAVKEVGKVVPYSTKPIVSRVPRDAQEFQLQESEFPPPIVPGNDSKMRSRENAQSTHITPGVSYADKVKHGIRHNPPHPTPPSMPVDTVPRALNRVDGSLLFGHRASMALGGVINTIILSPRDVGIGELPDEDTRADDNHLSGIGASELPAATIYGSKTLASDSSLVSNQSECMVAAPLSPVPPNSDSSALEVAQLKMPVPDGMRLTNRTNVLLRKSLLIQAQGGWGNRGEGSERNNDCQPLLLSGATGTSQIEPVSVSQPTPAQSLYHNLVVSDHEFCFVESNSQVEEDSISNIDEPSQPSEATLLPFDIPRSSLPSPSLQLVQYPLGCVPIDNVYYAFNSLAEPVVQENIKSADHNEDERSSVFVYPSTTKYPRSYKVRACYSRFT